MLKWDMTRWCRRHAAANRTSLKAAWPQARASLEELLLDFQDYLRQKGLPLWSKDNPNANEIRKLCYQKNRSYLTYKTYIEASPPEIAANTMIYLIHQTNYLLDQQLRALEREFLKNGGFTERLYRTRSQMRNGRKKI